MPVFDRILESYEVCTELFSRPENSECAYLCVDVDKLFFTTFTGKNIAVIEQRKAFWELCLNIRLISQRDVTKFRVANFCSEYNFPGT